MLQINDEIRDPSKQNRNIKFLNKKHNDYRKMKSIHHNNYIMLITNAVKLISQNQTYYRTNIIFWGRDPLTMVYLENESSYQYEKNLCSSIYILIVIQISNNFIII
jgi:hypothetical protein